MGANTKIECVGSAVKPSWAQARFLAHLTRGDARYSEYSRGCGYHIGNDSFVAATVAACLKRGWAVQHDGTVTITDSGRAVLALYAPATEGSK
jgi:hypothetical protein